MTSITTSAVTEFDRIVEKTRSERFVVAYSGGLDSSVLLSLAAEYAATRDLEICAIHIDHGLQDPSPLWAEHCTRCAKKICVPCEVVVLDAKIPPRMNMEEWARDERYRVFKGRTDSRTCVLTGHHLDDHVETVLHHAMRGSGPHGLSGIRSVRRFGDGYLARPLLQFRRSELVSYAEESGLKWIEDPSNEDERRTRNRIRRRLLPLLESEFSGVVNNLRRMAEVQARLVDATDRNVDIALDAAACPSYQIRIDMLLDFAPELRAFVLKRWLARAGFPVPGGRHLEQILGQVLVARPDAMPSVRWSGCEVRRYRNHLYCMRCLKEKPGHDGIAWDLANALHLPWGSLFTRTTQGAGIEVRSLKNAVVDVQFRGGGEQCRPAFRSHSHTLKNLFQEWQVPPWERDRTPLIYVDGNLAAVGHYCVCRDFAVEAGAEGVEIVWKLNIYN